MRAAAVIPPNNCATTRSTALAGVMALTSANASDIAGLNNPPEMRKKTHTLTMSENPNDNAMNIRLDVSTVLVADAWDAVGGGLLLLRFAI